MVVMVTSKAVVVLVVLLCSRSAAGIPLADFYSFGTSTGDARLLPNDDGSSPAISLPFPFPYFDVDYTQIYVSLHYLIYNT